MANPYGYTGLFFNFYTNISQQVPIIPGNHFSKINIAYQD